MKLTTVFKQKLSLNKLTTRAKGQVFENRACDYLVQNGLTLICKNFHASCGELDLIMRDNDTLVFVEVRFRKNKGFGGALASVDRHKQKKLIKTAQVYLQKQSFYHQPCRFDVVAITEDDIQWEKNVLDGF